MKRVLVLTLVCFVVSLLFVSVVIFVERSQPQVENLPELRPCNGSVCLFSIAPNETSITDAQGVLTKTQAFTFASFGNGTALFPLLALALITICSVTAPVAHSFKARWTFQALKYMRIRVKHKFKTY